MYGDQSRVVLDADYDRTPQKTCEALVRSWTALYGTLDFLEHVADFVPFPSQTFVPNWTEARPRGASRWNTDRRFEASTTYDASAGQRTDWEMDAHGGACCSGVVVDTISSRTSANWKNYTNTVREAKILLDFADRRDETYKMTGESIHDAFLLTMSAGAQYERHSSGNAGNSVRRRDVNKHLLGWLKWVDRNIGHTHVPLGSREHQVSVDSVHDFFRSVVYGRRFIVTKEGYFGFAPESCKIGDTVVVLLGGRSPCILRSPEASGEGSQKRGDGKFTWKVLGSAYIHGIMHGECFAGSDSSKFTTTSITMV